MADVSDFHLLVGVEEEEEEEEEDVEVNVVSVPSWSIDFENDETCAFDSDPVSPRLSDFLLSEQSGHTQVVVDGEDIVEFDACIRTEEPDDSDSESITNIIPLNQEDQVNFVIDLLGSHVEHSHVIDNNVSVLNPSSERVNDSNLPSVEGSDNPSSNFLDLGLGLGLGLDLDKHVEEDQTGGFMIEDYGDEFCFTRRASVSEPGGSSTLHAVQPFGKGLRVVGIESDSDEEDECVLGTNLNPEDDDGLDQAPDDLGLPLCWDCLHLDDHRDTNEDFGWEEIGRLADREILSLAIDAADDERSISTEFHSEEEANPGREAAMRNLEWEFLISENNFERHPESEPDAESYLTDHVGYIYPVPEYGMLFGQFSENESSLRGGLPAGKSVVENLPLVFLTPLDVQNNNVLCAVCKDEISMKEQAKLLPCTHHYHVDCITPWLGIRNTCPVCRYELPTDDPDYELRRCQRAGRHLPGDFQVR